MHRWGTDWRLAVLMGCAICTGCLGGCDTSTTSAQQHGSLPTWVLNPAKTFTGAKAQALALAAQQGDVAKINHLMKDEHVDPDHYFGDDGYVDGNVPLLAWPILAQNPAGLKAMLDDGADPNARKPGRVSEKRANGKVVNYCNYDSAMVWGAKAENPIYLKLLLAHGGNPNTHTVNCESLLYQAFIWHGQWQNVQVLVEHGANVNADTFYDPAYKGEDETGSILNDYTAYGDFDKAWWLIKHGADPHFPRWVGDHNRPRYPVLEDIFWYPAKPSYRHWQVDDQCWALRHGYHRPPVMPDYYRKLRRELKYPSEEKNIPLPDCKGQSKPAGKALNREQGHAVTAST